MYVSSGLFFVPQARVEMLFFRSTELLFDAKTNMTSINSRALALVSQADVRTLCKKTSWSERKVQVWFRRRRNQERPGLRKRFSEARCVAGPNTDVRTSVLNIQRVSKNVILFVFPSTAGDVFFIFLYLFTES